MGITITWQDPDPSQQFDMTGLSFAAFTTLTNESATSFQWNSSDGSFWMMTGSGFTYDGNGIPTGGTITSIDTTTGIGHPAALITGLVLPASLFSSWVLTNNSSAFISVGLDGYDTVYGNAGNDTLLGGAGADTLYGEGGNDTLLSGPEADFAGQAYRLYEVTLGRGPDPGGFDFWIGQLHGGMSLNAAASGFTGSPEFQATYGSLDDTQFVTLLYNNALHRAPDPGGLAFWLGQLSTGTSRSDVVLGFSESPEEQGNQRAGLQDFVHFSDPAQSNVLDGGTGTDTVSYVNAAGSVTVSLAVSGPQETFGGGVDTLVGIENLTGSAFADTLTGDGNPNVLSSGAGNDTLDSNGGQEQDWAGQAYRLYEVTLGRGPDPGGFDFWIGQLHGGMSLNAAASGFTGSPEFQATYGSLNDTQFVTLLYNNALHRAPDPGGLAFWLGQLSTGTSRSDVVLGFSESPEEQGNQQAGVQDFVHFSDLPQSNVLDGGAGTDTASYASAVGHVTSGVTLGVTVSLAVSGPQETFGAGVDTLVNIENLTGSAFADTLTGDANANVLSGGAGDDTLIGGAGDDTLIGGPGADSLDGGTGNDYASYINFKSNSADGLTASLADPSVNTGDAVGDTYTSIERLEGSAFNDVLIGDANSNSLRGGLGADVLNGGAGTDTASYFNSTTAVIASLANPGLNTGEAAGDTYISIENLSGSAFADTLTGDSGNNTLLGNGGPDVLDGGTGFDFASYLNSTTGLTASLANSAVNTGEAAGDTYISIEGLQGSAFADTLIGNSANNTLISNGGGDTLIGGAGSDTFRGGPGSDTFYGNQPGSILDGVTDVADYSTVTGLAQGIVVNWAAGTVVGQVGIIDTDHMVGIEAVFGTAFDDTFDATSYSSSLVNSGDFNDYQLVRGGGGNDTIIGDINGDFTSIQTEAIYSDATSGITATMTSFGTGTVTGGGVGTNSLQGVQRIIGSNFDDTFNGTSGPEIFDGYLGGNDTYHGGGGVDTVEYDGSSYNAIDVELAAGTITGRSGGSNIGNDVLDSIEEVRGSEQADLYNAAGFSGSSVNAGSSGTFNQFQGQGGADTIVGNNNTQLVYYAASSGITISMSGAGAGTATATYGSDTSTDTFTGVNSIRGSNFNDIFVGSAGSENFDGRSGNDTLNGGGGADTLTGGSGNDTFVYTATTDSQPGAGNFDTITDFTHGSDKIDLSALAGLANALTTVVSAPANIAANSLVAYVSGGSTILYANTSAAPQAVAGASMEIHLTGVTTLSDADIMHHA